MKLSTLKTFLKPENDSIPEQYRELFMFQYIDSKWYLVATSGIEMALVEYEEKPKIDCKEMIFNTGLQTVLAYILQQLKPVLKSTCSKSEILELLKKVCDFNPEETIKLTFYHDKIFIDNETNHLKTQGADKVKTSTSFNSGEVIPVIYLNPTIFKHFLESIDDDEIELCFYGYDKPLCVSQGKFKFCIMGKLNSI